MEMTQIFGCLFCLSAVSCPAQPARARLRIASRFPPLSHVLPGPTGRDYEQTQKQPFPLRRVLPGPTNPRSLANRFPSQ